MSSADDPGHQNDLFATIPPQATTPPGAVTSAPPASSLPAAAPVDLAELPADAPVGAGSSTARRIPQKNQDKDPEAFRTIGEVATALDIAPHVLRYWEEQFPMLRPVKRSGGRRYYRSEDIALVETIHRLVHAEGYTLRGARQLLAGAAKAARGSARSLRGEQPGLAQGQLPPEPAPDGAAPASPVPVAILHTAPAAESARDVLKQLRAIRSTLASALKVS